MVPLSFSFPFCGHFWYSNIPFNAPATIHSIRTVVLSCWVRLSWTLISLHPNHLSPDSQILLNPIPIFIFIFGAASPILTLKFHAGMCCFRSWWHLKMWLYTLSGRSGNVWSLLRGISIEMWCWRIMGMCSLWVRSYASSIKLPWHFFASLFGSNIFF